VLLPLFAYGNRPVRIGWPVNPWLAVRLRYPCLFQFLSLDLLLVVVDRKRGVESPDRADALDRSRDDGHRFGPLCSQSRRTGAVACGHAASITANETRTQSLRYTIRGLETGLVGKPDWITSRQSALQFKDLAWKENRSRSPLTRITSTLLSVRTALFGGSLSRPMELPGNRC